MTEQSQDIPSQETEAAWYDINIAGRNFNIASRRGEAHIRAVERLIGETVKDIDGRLEGQGPANTALLIALNLADQLLTIREERQQNTAADDKLAELVTRLNASLDIQSSTSDHKEGKDISAVYEKLEFF